MDMGDIIYVPILRKVGLGPRHYGIYDGSDGVYHFCQENLNEAYVRYSSLTEFSQGASIGVEIYTKKYSNQEIIKRAQSKVNTDFGGYHCISNNCEHFATWCVTGRKVSSQTTSEPAEHAERREMLDNKKSSYYDEPGHIFCSHETSEERLENYAIEQVAKVVASPILAIKRLFND
ncbi:MAG: lecithin retinol acyltransferase family protein [Pelosinus sp.]|nr:lecithin retinol acyltransferase family protein [Pelosinus sp.]